MPEQGYLIIADITGYTAFLSQSELVHAEDALSDLFKTLLAQIQRPLAVSKLEGDAVFCYAPEGSFRQAQTLIETIENIYLAFRQTRRRMKLNTTCTCQACVNIPNLDLKFFIHYGTYVFQTMGTFTELVGSDVNLLHRLTKNTVTERLGLRAYAMYTESVIEALEFGPLVDSMTRHTDTFEHLGEVISYVEDMHGTWERGRTERHVVIEPNRVLRIFDFDLPVPPSVAWDYVTKPEYRMILMASDRQTLTDQKDGRTVPGTTYHCAHGETVFKMVITEWLPFEYYAWQERGGMKGTTNELTMELTATEQGTHVTLTVGKTDGPPHLRIIADTAIRLRYMPPWERGVDLLIERVQADIAAGLVVEPQATQITPDIVERAIAESLVQ